MVQLSGTSLHVSNSLHTFLTDQVGKLDLATYLLDGYTAESFVTTEEINYLDVKVGGNISYLPTDKFESDVDPWTSKNRTDAKPGRALRKAFLKTAVGSDTFPLKRLKQDKTPALIKQISDEMVDRFVVTLQATYQLIEMFIVTGEAIRHFYYEGNYTSSENSTLHASCMRYSREMHKARNYAKNPRTIGLLVVLDAKGKLRARALVWNSPLGMMMDRVYGTDQLRAAMRRLAAERGWMTRDGDAAGNNGLLRPDGTKVDYYIVPMQTWVPGSKPYMDTLQPSQLHASGHFTTEQMDRWYGDARRNPIVYTYCGLGRVPNTRPTAHPIWLQPSGTSTQEMRDDRVNWLSDFDQVPPWPEDLIRSNEKWVYGEDPENDTENWAFLPQRRTTALVVKRPKPKPTAWKSGLPANFNVESTIAGINELRNNIEALAEAFANVANPAAIPVVNLAAAPAPMHDFAIAMEEA